LHPALAPAPPPVARLFPDTTLFRSELQALGQRLRAPCAPAQPRHARRRASRRGRAAAALARGGGQERQRGGRVGPPRARPRERRSEEHTSELQSRENLVCRPLREKK